MNRVEQIHKILHEFVGVRDCDKRNWCDAKDHAEAIARLYNTNFEWFPMKDAPTDGTLIMARDADGRVTTIKWYRSLIERGGYWILNVAGKYAESHRFEPISWRPLEG
jgi:hypothetical protein